MRPVPPQSRFEWLWINIQVGIKSGLLLATGFSLFVAVMAILRGSTYYEQYHTTTFKIILTYFAAGVLGGAVWGLLIPVVRKGRLGAIVVGMIVGPLVYGCIAVAMDGPSAFFSLPSIIAGVLVGGGAGWHLSRAR